MSTEPPETTENTEPVPPGAATEGGAPGAEGANAVGGEAVGRNSGTGDLAEAASAGPTASGVQGSGDGMDAVAGRAEGSGGEAAASGASGEDGVDRAEDAEKGGDGPVTSRSDGLGGDSAAGDAERDGDRGTTSKPNSQGRGGEAGDDGSAAGDDGSAAGDGGSPVPAAGSVGRDSASAARTSSAGDGDDDTATLTSPTADSDGDAAAQLSEAEAELAAQRVERERIERRKAEKQGPVESGAKLSGKAADLLAAVRAVESGAKPVATVFSEPEPPRRPTPEPVRRPQPVAAEAPAAPAPETLDGVRRVLTDGGAPEALAPQVAAMLGEGAGDRLRADPWQLLRVGGVRPEQADGFARALLGAECGPDDERRGRAVTVWLLEQAALAGHTALEMPTLTAALAQRGVPDADTAVQNTLAEGEALAFQDALDEPGAPVRRDDDEAEEDEERPVRVLVGLERYALAEESLADGLARLINSVPKQDGSAEEWERAAAAAGPAADLIRAVSAHGLVLHTGGEASLAEPAALLHAAQRLGLRAWAATHGPLGRGRFSALLSGNAPLGGTAPTGTERDARARTGAPSYGETPTGTAPHASTPTGTTPHASTPTGTTPHASTPTGTGPNDRAPAGPTSYAATPAGTAASAPAADPSTPSGLPGVATVAGLLSGAEGPGRDVDGALDLDLLVVLDAPQLDVETAALLTESLPDGARLVLAGDPAVLWSAGPGRVFADLLAARICPQIASRRPDPGPLGELVSGIGIGELNQVEAPGKEVVIVPVRDAGEAVHRTVQLVADSVPRAIGVPPEETRVITPGHGGAAGTRALNAALKERLNPGPGRFGGFDPGDRVAYSPAPGRTVPGHVVKADAEGLHLACAGETVVVPKERVEQSVRHGWALTAHQAVGCRWPAVVVVLPGDAAQALNRPWVYTAFSRADRHLSVVHGVEQALPRAVAEVPQKPRTTRLPVLLRPQVPAVD